VVFETDVAQNLREPLMTYLKIPKKNAHSERPHFEAWVIIAP
jgi:hypothetical protein